MLAAESSVVAPGLPAKGLVGWRLASGGTRFGLRLWRRLWLDADVDGLVRLAWLKDDFARGDAPATALPAMQQLEDRFGLSPKARRALQWEVSREQVASDERPSLAVVKPLKLDKAPGA